VERKVIYTDAMKRCAEIGRITPDGLSDVRLLPGQPAVKDPGDTHIPSRTLN